MIYTIFGKILILSEIRKVIMFFVSNVFYGIILLFKRFKTHFNILYKDKLKKYHPIFLRIKN